MNARLKELYRKLFRFFPIYRYYRITANRQINSEELGYTIKRSIKDVPFYNGYSSLFSSENGISSLPVIRKSDILGHEEKMVSTRVCKRLLRTVETGGSTGYSLTLYRHWRDDVKETAFRDYAMSIIGENLIVGVLRGNKPKNGSFEVMSKDRVILSSYDLCDANVDEYLKILVRQKVSCLHAYPSSLVIFARLIKRRYGKANLPDLKGIFTSSEIFSKDDKQLVHEVFPNVTIVDYYGHSEMACCAISVNEGFYHFLPAYGYVEFVDTGETINGNRIAEIVATSIMNSTMPFIRYATDDYAEIDEKGNIISIIGRTSDFLVNREFEVTPCIVLTRNESLKNVTNFQFFQDTVGEMVFRVVTNGLFGEEDRESLLEDLQSSFGGKMECRVEEVPAIGRTRAGKQKRLDQRLNIRDYM